jgi:hypothetical protein
MKGLLWNGRSEGQCPLDLAFSPGLVEQYFPVTTSCRYTSPVMENFPESTRSSIKVPTSVCFRLPSIG